MLQQWMRPHDSQMAVPLKGIETSWISPIQCNRTHNSKVSIRISSQTAGNMRDADKRSASHVLRQSTRLFIELSLFPKDCSRLGRICLRRKVLEFRKFSLSYHSFCSTVSTLCKKVRSNCKATAYFKVVCLHYLLVILFFDQNFYVFFVQALNQCGPISRF